MPSEFVVLATPKTRLIEVGMGLLCCAGLTEDDRLALPKIKLRCFVLVLAEHGH